MTGLCELYFNAESGNCTSSKLVGDESLVYNTSCLSSRITDNSSVYFSEEGSKDGNTLTCVVWETTSFSETNLILPSIVFASLCFLLAVMIYKAV